MIVSTADPSAHVRQTREVLDMELQLDRLLALTEGHAPPGIPSLQLVLAAISAPTRPNWLALTSLPLTAAQVSASADRLETRLTRMASWDALALDAALSQAAEELAVASHHVQRLAAVFVLGDVTPLPVTAVLGVIGRERTVARLHTSSRMFHSMQMVN
jgi:hypothetical protein